MLPLKERIDARLQRIANVLLLNASFIDNLGLLNGKMGIAIFFYHYARYTGNEVYENYAGELIDEIYEEISFNTPVDFANGLTGIGWGIEYLVQNGFVEADTDEALEEMDHKIYKARLNCPILIENSNDLFGFGFYYLSRLRGKKNDDENLRTLEKKYHLIFLTDECERLLIHKRFLDYKMSVLSIATLNSIAYFLLEMHKLGLFPSKINKLFHYLPSFLEFILQKESDMAERSTMMMLVINIWDICAKDLKPPYISLVNRSNETNLEFEKETEVAEFVKSTWHSLVYKPYVVSSSPDEGSQIRAFEIIDNEEDWNVRLNRLNKNNLGLTDFAGIGLGLMNIINEGIKELKIERIEIEKSDLQFN